jgi:hypothetical protein
VKCEEPCSCPLSDWSGVVVKCKGPCSCPLSDCSAVVVKCEGPCSCHLSAANPLLWSLYRGLAFSRLLEIYEYTDRKVTNDLYLFTAPKSPSYSAGLQTPAVIYCCNKVCAAVHIYVMTVGNLRNLAGHTVPYTQHGAAQTQLSLINYRTFL